MPRQRPGSNVRPCILEVLGIAVLSCAVRSTDESAAIELRLYARTIPIWGGRGVQRTPSRDGFTRPMYRLLDGLTPCLALTPFRGD
eukprot:553418-Prymnesium_polylepis.1